MKLIAIEEAQISSELLSKTKVFIPLVLHLVKKPARKNNFK
jgi:hypothetical protein